MMSFELDTGKKSKTEIRLPSINVIVVGGAGHHVVPAVVLLFENVELVQVIDLVDAEFGHVVASVFGEGYQGVVGSVFIPGFQVAIPVIVIVIIIPVIKAGGEIDVVAAPGAGAKSGLQAVFLAHEAHGIADAALGASVDADGGLG